ncbi:uncharacterized protein LOC135701397 [Ochlerotatus camptorhynchus]|uniref:uncharacterized protein LOC135701397 n=1 Tax=Ochlerotatus camptorhynchus TaxID=644619 RepID=UPI0031E15256
MCGFTEDENIVRLQKSLKGRAYDAVKSRLMHSGNVPGILSTLKMLFGQPEVIIQSLIRKVSSLSSIREDKLETLVDFAVNVQNFCATVDACGLQEYMYNVTLLHQLVGKLTPSLKLNWAQHRRTLSLVNQRVSSYFHRRYMTGSQLKTKRGGLRKEMRTSTPILKRFVLKTTVAIRKNRLQLHQLRRRNPAKSARELASRPISANVFWNCLRIHKGYCKAKPCGKDGCTYRHHELLHNNSKENPKNTGSTTEGEQSSQSSTSKSGCNTHQTTVSSCLRWTGGTERHEADSHIYNLHIAGGKNESKKFLLSDVRTVKALLLPQQTMDMAKLSQLYPHLRDLPIDSHRDARPRILIGMKHALLSLGLKNREGEIGQPIAVKTRLGWTVCGGWTFQNEASLHHYTFHVCPCSVKSDEDLHQAMKDYFSIDSLGLVKSEKALLSVEDERAVSLFQSLTRRKDDRYESGLLWRFDDARLPDSRSMALRRFQCLKKRMEKDPQLSNTLQAKIAEYVEKQYIRKLTDEKINQKVPRRWYLPIFPVTNPNKPGKVRIVWDAAAIAYGTSLSSALLKGPDLLCSLLAILLQFRERRIGLTGDIREMFHQVLIRAEDQLCQCFFWIDEHGAIVVYVMQVMTFGACCSPST